ncbi:ATP-binding protein [Paraburkholderia sp. RL17-337-BIB-A]|uniref:ATP-binding protein n=1 Tax=Paraburkholderia sp. RL17-337-BIB-A TaxID=3031636 RepID=UPI0038BDB7C0
MGRESRLPGPSGPGNRTSRIADLTFRNSASSCRRKRWLLQRSLKLFAQSARGNARAEGGLGIGLAVAKRMVELHDGTISLHSDGTGRGTSVTLRLPILRSGPGTTATVDTAQSLCLGPVRLLLVDDNVDALQSPGVLLELEGHQVTTCNGGREAVQLIKETLP